MKTILAPIRRKPNRKPATPFTPQTIKAIVIAILALIGGIIAANTLKIDISVSKLEFHLSQQ